MTTVPAGDAELIALADKLKARLPPNARIGTKYGAGDALLDGLILRALTSAARERDQWKATAELSGHHHNNTFKRAAAAEARIATLTEALTRISHMGNGLRSTGAQVMAEIARAALQTEGKAG